ncbi:MAG: RES family NAD+ phosphorylase [Bacteroidota bacterium]|nr:RES family NAD+ phosphorylase [Bacteroidota bacterium]
MIIYRLTTSKFSGDLSGEGAKIYGGRWNPVGLAALYLSEFISLSILEILVRANKYNSPDSYSLLTIQLPEDSVNSIELKKLKTGWQNHIEYTRSIGEDFIRMNQALVLKVPSAIVPQEHNYLINPAHKDSKKIKIIVVELLELDKRLFQI